MAHDPGRVHAARQASPASTDRGSSNVPAWLGLLHPDGPSVSAPPAHDDSRDIVLLVPTAAELGAPGALQRALTRLSREIGADGVAYVVVPRRSRWRAARLATRQGLDVGPWLLHLPSLAASQHVVPVERHALRYALGTLLHLRPWVRRLLLALVTGGGAAVLPLLVPWASLVVRRPGARPLLQWLHGLAATASPGEPVGGGGTAIVAPGWRAGQGSVVVHRLRENEARPDVIAKVAPAAAAAPHAEWDNLARFGSTAARAGVTVPARVALTDFGKHTVLVQSAVRGQPAAVRLRSLPSHLPRVIESLTGWLGRWHAITRAGAAGPSPGLSRMLDGLDRLAPYVAGTAPYRRWLVARCESPSTGSVPLVAAHNDLTMWNVLVDDDGNLGVVDWEHATADSLPLTDFFYAMADALVAAGRHADRRAAAAACVGTGEPAALARRHWQRLVADLGLDEDLPTLAFHACWIHHGANALGEPGDGARAFIDIVRWLAAARVTLDPGRRS